MFMEELLSLWQLSFGFSQTGMMMMRSIRPWLLVYGLRCPPLFLSLTRTNAHARVYTLCSLAAWGETCCNLGGREQRALLMQRLAGPFDVEPSQSLLTPHTYTHVCVRTIKHKDALQPLHHRHPKHASLKKKGVISLS